LPLKPLSQTQNTGEESDCPAGRRSVKVQTAICPILCVVKVPAAGVPHMRAGNDLTGDNSLCPGSNRVAGLSCLS